MLHITWENHKQFATTSVLERQKAFQLTFRTETFKPTFPLPDANLDLFYHGILTFLGSLSWALWPVTEVIQIVTVFNLSLIILCLLENSPVLWNDSFGGAGESPSLLWICKESVLWLPSLPPQVSFLLFLCWLSLTTDLNVANLISSDFSELSWTSLGCLPSSFSHILGSFSSCSLIQSGI